MSTVRADNYATRDGSQSITGLTLTQGSAKLWSSFNGTGTIAARDDFNVASYVDHGAGDYTINFSGARPSANYTMTVSAQVIAGGGGPVHPFAFNNAGNFGLANPTTTAARSVVLFAGAFTDTAHFLAVVHGDPA